MRAGRTRGLFWFSGTGPAETRCGQCAERREIRYRSRDGKEKTMVRCELFYAATDLLVKVDSDVPSCKYWREEKPPCTE